MDISIFDLNNFEYHILPFSIRYINVCFGTVTDFYKDNIEQRKLECNKHRFQTAMSLYCLYFLLEVKEGWDIE